MVTISVLLRNVIKKKVECTASINLGIHTTVEQKI